MFRVAIEGVEKNVDFVELDEAIPIVVYANTQTKAIEKAALFVGRARRGYVWKFRVISIEEVPQLDN